MAILAAIHHKTEYRYDRPVTLTPQIIRLRPAPQARTPVLNYSLKISPAQHFINWQQDPFGNWMARVVFPERVTEFKIEVDLTADLTVYNPFDFFLEPDAEHWPMQYPAYLQDDLAVYCKVEPAGPLLKAWLAQVNRQPRPMADTLVALNQRLASEIEYV
ncbi:MAG: transglutaminase N-terminal domain-containing protein, partial [Burkholderiaceae bacterium]